MIQYLDNNNKNLYLIDIETNGLNPDTIWCAVIKHKTTQQVWRFVNNDGSGGIYNELKKFIEERSDAVWVGHNFLSFDAVVIDKLCGISIPVSSIIDTLVLSYLYNPAIEGFTNPKTGKYETHSLWAYGKRLNFQKVDHDDWSKFSPDMLYRCEKDVDLTEKVYDALVVRMTKIGYSNLSCSIEHEIRKIIDQQQENGFYFDIIGAKSLRDQLRQREADLSEGIHKLFPPKLETVGQYLKSRRKDGSCTESFTRHQQTYPRVDVNEDSSYSVLDWISFNIGSSKQRLTRLRELGYEPTAVTKKGNPKIDEDSLNAYAELTGKPEIKAMAEWLVCNGRANMIETWLSFVGPDSRIHGRVFTCGAASRRMTHNSPNTANIPSEHNGAAYGRECRELWQASPGWVLVGYDAKGLETVGLCHYLNNPKATKILTEEDIHTRNMEMLSKALGFPVVRGGGGSKTLWYAWLYGAYPKKLGSIIKRGEADGQIITDTLISSVPGLKRLVNEVETEFRASGGILKTVDGGFVRCPSQHAALNYKVQSLGGIVMKLAAIILDSKLREKGIETRLVGSIHDEGQIETRKEDARVVGETAVQSIREAAEQLRFNIPLDGDYKVGLTWAETH